MQVSSAIELNVSIGEDAVQPIQLSTLIRVTWACNGKIESDPENSPH